MQSQRAPVESSGALFWFRTRLLSQSAWQHAIGVVSEEIAGRNLLARPGHHRRTMWRIVRPSLRLKGDHKGLRLDTRR